MRNGSSPRLRTVTLLRERVADWESYPFNIPIVKNLEQIEFKKRVCFFVGENGSGKSTLLEAIADHCGYGREGGSKNIRFETAPEQNSSIGQLSKALRLSWSQKLLQGFFLRAESFFNIASYLDDVGMIGAYGGKSLHQQSHGESFLSLFENRFSRKGFYLLDEPEAALSPQRQLTLLVVLHSLLRRNQEIQFIIASHSPIILSYPDAQIFSFNGKKLKEITYKETEPYQIVSGFLKNPDGYLRKLFEESEPQRELL